MSKQLLREEAIQSPSHNFIKHQTKVKLTEMVDVGSQTLVQG